MGRKYRQVGAFSLNISEPSAICFISPDVGFLVLEDESSIVWQVELPQSSEGPVVKKGLELNSTIWDIEAAAFDAEKKNLLVLSEQSRHVYEIDLIQCSSGQLGLGTPRRHKRRLKRVQREPNHGYEGIATLPGHHSPDGKTWVLAVNERRPRRVCFFDPKTFKYAGYAKLARQDKPLFPDLSSIAVAKNGALYLLSDEGNGFGEFSLQRSAQKDKSSWTINLIEFYSIELEGLPLSGVARLQPEGMTFDDQGDLWIVAEGNGLLIHFRHQNCRVGE